MRFRVGAKVCVKNVYSGGNFSDGDIVVITQIGSEDEANCYGAISPYDRQMWYLYDDEVDAATIADLIRSLSDERLARLLTSVLRNGICHPGLCLDGEACIKCALKCLQEPPDN